MPHYRDGTEAKVGDRARGHCHSRGAVTEGILVAITSGATMCNGLLAYPVTFPAQHGAGPLIVSLITGWCTLADLERVG